MRKIVVGRTGVTMPITPIAVSRMPSPA